MLMDKHFLNKFRFSLMLLFLIVNFKNVLAEEPKAETKEEGKLEQAFTQYFSVGGAGYIIKENKEFPYKAKGFSLAYGRSLKTFYEYYSFGAETGASFIFTKNKGTGNYSNMKVGTLNALAYFDAFLMKIRLGVQYGHYFNSDLKTPLEPIYGASVSLVQFFNLMLIKRAEPEHVIKRYKFDVLYGGDFVGGNGNNSSTTQWHFSLVYNY